MKKILALLIVLTLVTQIIPVFGLAAHMSRSANVVKDGSGPNLDEMICPLMVEGNVGKNEEKAENSRTGNCCSSPSVNVGNLTETGSCCQKAEVTASASFSRHAEHKDEDCVWNPVNPRTIGPEHALSADDLLVESATLQPASSSTTLFTEGFEGSFPSTNWWVGDDDSNNGADYWDDTSHRARSGSWSGWCAGIGSKPDGTHNTADWTYDDYMAAYLSRRAGEPFDARYWDVAFLTYYVWYDIESGYDELDLSVTGDGTNWGGIFQYDSNSLTSGDWVLDGSSGGVFDYRVGRVPESTSAGAVYTSSFNIGFYFQSDYSIHKEGAYLDDISFKVYDITCPYVSVSKTQASPGETIQLGYKIDNISPFDLKIWLGATLTDQYGNQINDPANDVIRTVSPGYQYYYRDFHIPASANPGTYDITYALWSGWTSPIDQSRQWWSWTWNDILQVGTKDLIIQDIWTQPSSPESGQPTTIWFRVKNIGTLGITEAFRNYLYVDGSYYTYRENNGLGAGATYDWSIPDVYLSPGNHALKVKADATNTVSESNEGNNERTETTYWKGPDLVVLDIWWDPSSPTSGQPFTIYFCIKNQEDGNAYGTFRNKLYIDGNYYAYGDNDGLSAGSTFTWQTPDVRLGYGPHTFMVVTDADNAVQEHNEGNNERSESCSVAKADWTVLAYLDGDCEPTYMEQFALDAFTGMAQVGSTGDLSIVVQLDRMPGGVVDPSNDWTDCCRFFITQGMTYAHSNALWSDEVNMGDDNTLINFVTWAINTRYYEAERYLLVLHNHGGSWVGCCWDDTSGHDRLDISEIKSAMSSIKSTLGKKVDVLWFNDCLMSAIEIATQVYPYADYMAGSETVAYTSTWSTSHYNTLMTTLRNTPSTSPQQLCIQITNIGHLTDSSTIRTQSLSSIDLSKISSLVSTVDSFALNLKNKLCTYYPQIDNARSSTGWFEGPYSGDQQEIIDLYHFAQNIKSDVPDSTIKSLAQNIMDKIGPAGGAVGYVIMRERHTTSVSYAHGLSIYFPSDSADYDSSYTTGSDFAANTRWDEFLVEYYTPKPDLTITVTAIDPSPPVSEQPVRIWFTLKNIGYGDATETFVNKFYVDGTYVAYQTQNGLEAGAVILIYYDTTLGPGYHVIRAVADANDNVAECDETNNEDTEKTWWLSSDLIVQDITTNPEEPVENQPFTIYFTVYNDGDLDVDVTFYTQLYIDGIQFGGDFPLSGLAKDASHTFSVPHDGLPEGTHEFEVVTDVYDDVDEANKDTGNGVGTGESNNQMSVWIYFPPHEIVQLGIIHQVQRKDTSMLCLGWGSNGEPYDGQLAWDRPHPTDLTHPTGSLLDDKYCSRASISMIVFYYGGTLSQDRISYYYFEELYGNGVPEGDLGCGSGMPQEEALIWALNGAAVTHYNGKPSFSQIKQWIDSGRPILRRHVHAEGAHATVIDGYDNLGQRVHLLDPWFTASEYYHEWWADYNSLDVEEVWVPSASAPGRSDEGTIWMDSDSDGVCDFDEIKRFYTDPYNSDTDGDDVPDKQEIISYTFLSDHSYDAMDLRKPDQDGDGHRCELDYDSDNGGAPDGQEDLNGNGFVDTGETDPLDPSDDPNQPPSILDIYPDSETESQGNTIRIYCDSNDTETPESTLTCKIWIRPSGESWVVSGETMSWDENNHYYDWNIPTSAKLGYYDVNCTVSDGELSDWRTDYNEFEVVDTTPPVVQITNPTTSSPIYTQSGTTLAVNYTYTELNPNNVTIRVHNTTHIIGETMVTGLVSGVDVMRSDFLNIPTWVTDGEYNVTVTIYDIVNQTGMDTQTNAVIIDNTPPLASITHPANGTYIRGVSVQIDGTVTESHMNGQLPQINDTRLTLTFWNGTHFGFENTTETIPDGMLTLKVNFTDLAENIGEATVWFTVDNTPPIKTVVSPPPGSYLDFSTVWINETLSDATSGIDPLTITMTLNGTPVTPNYDPATGLLSYHAIGLSDGNYTVVVSVQDLAGNHAINSWWFIIDTEALADLIVDNIWLVPEGLEARRPFDIYFRIKNEGDVNAVETFNCSILIDGSEYAIVGKDGLGAGDNYTWSIKVDDLFLRYGYHTFTVIVDADDDVRECDEYNNSLSETCWFSGWFSWGYPLFIIQPEEYNLSRGITYRYSFEFRVGHDENMEFTYGFSPSLNPLVVTWDPSPPIVIPWGEARWIHIDFDITVPLDAPIKEYPTTLWINGSSSYTSISSDHPYDGTIIEGKKRGPFRVIEASAHISVSANVSPALIGFRVQINGLLTWQHNGTGIPNAPIMLSYTYHPALISYIPEDKNWNVISTVTTNTDGSYSATWFAMSSGYYVVEAFYPGFDGVQEATSSTNLLTTRSYDRVFSVSSNSTVSAMNLNSTTQELTFTVSGHSGTTGYLHMFLAKSLIPDLSQLKIYLDGNETSYDAILVDNTWFIRLTYTHSTHTVRISLGSAPTTLAVTAIQVPPLALLLTVLAAIAIIFAILRYRTYAHAVAAKEKYQVNQNYLKVPIKKPTS